MLGIQTLDCAIPERQLCDRLSGQLSDQQQQVGEDSQDLRILVKTMVRKKGSHYVVFNVEHNVTNINNRCSRNKYS